MTVYGSNESPHKKCVAILADLFQQINSSNFNLPKFNLPVFRNLQKETVTFLITFVCDETALLREDSKELALISLLNLLGYLSNLIPICAPGAHHHARWMAKIIYTIKITLFRANLKNFLNRKCLIPFEIFPHFYLFSV